MSSKIRNAINARQIKAARALLDWSQEHLAEACNLSIATIRKIESGHISPRGSTMNGIRSALEDAGLEFIDPNGVRERPEEIRIYEGQDGFVDFFTEVHQTASRKGGEFVCVCESEPPFASILGDFDKVYRQWMSDISDLFSFKSILTENIKDPLCANYCTYRTISRQYVDSVPIYVFDDKYAMFLFDANPLPKIIVVQSRSVADAFRRQFYSMWDKATPLNTTPVKSQSDVISHKKSKKPGRS